jgi:hypothetical protein
MAPTRGEKCDVRREKKAGPRSGALPTSVEGEGVERSIFGRDERGWVLLAGLPTNRHFAKQKAPESVRTSGIALRRLWALSFYNR